MEAGISMIGGDLHWETSALRNCYRSIERPQQGAMRPLWVAQTGPENEPAARERCLLMG